MQTKLTWENKWNLPKVSVDVLPMIAALFKGGSQPDFEWLKDPDTKQNALCLTVPGKAMMDLPWTTGGQVDAHRRCPSPARLIEIMEQRTSAVPKEISHHLFARNFIRGVSHHFNNLLMGIWGHASLIRIQAKPGSRNYDTAVQIERLIQSGSFLIHVILGYMGERRKAVKRMRLNHLVKEVQALTRTGDPVFDFIGLDTLMQLLSQAKQAKSIASSTGWVLERLLKEIETYLNAISGSGQGHKALRKHLATINILVERGLLMTRKMRMYSGDIRSRKRYVNIEKIVRDQVRDIRKQNKQLRVSCEVNAPPVYALAERNQIVFVLRQLIDNAVHAMSESGELHISLKTLHSEAPHNRCVLRPGYDFAVIAVKDTGPGIDKNSQAHIFEPFFSISGKYGAVGLGLSAASGIVKSYGGYIHVQSVPDAGSIFKIYWPVRRKQRDQRTCTARSMAVPA